MNNQREHVKAQIFREGAETFAVLDGASVPGLLARLQADQPEFVCLYAGEVKPDVAEVAPYLVRMVPETAWADWVVAEGWGKHWGVFAIAGADLRSMRQHFRRFLTVHDPAGKPMLFRYYDPRVLRVYLPTCNAEELAQFFGPVDCFVMEGDKPDVALRFELRDQALDRVEKPLK